MEFNASFPSTQGQQTGAVHLETKFVSGAVDSAVLPYKNENFGLVECSDTWRNMWSFIRNKVPGYIQSLRALPVNTNEVSSQGHAQIGNKVLLV